MDDILFHRFPGEHIQKYLGEFIQVEGLLDQKGFIISSFDQNEKYIFKKSEQLFREINKFHFSTTVPYVISKKEYLTQAKDFISSINLSDVDKAILSRVKRVEIQELDFEAYFETLCTKYPDTFVYLVSSRDFGTWIGATPEVLLKVTGEIASTMSLAGTKKDEYKEWTKKEFEEQEYVTKYIADIIKKNDAKNIKINGPYTFQAGPVYHLKTDFLFEISNKSILRLITDFHPTPAIGGFPLNKALDLIYKTEKHSRRLYSGFIGRIDEDSTNLFVNLRCCQVIENDVFLYLGGGLIKDSIPADEWEETESKSQTLILLF